MLKDSIVIAYLRNPKERIWGILRSVDSSGIFLEGISVDSFEEWIGDIVKEEHSAVGLSKIFFPASRIEKILIDEPTGSIPSLSQRFEEKVGKSVEEYFCLKRDQGEK